MKNSENMEKINAPEGLPECKIINALIAKSNSKTDYEFNYIQELEILRNKISIEVSRINLLFPEYTPHDEKYHLKRLFYIADQMLGDELIESMNVTELFLLAASLYGHDWGMAISETEKEFILSNNSQLNNNDLNLLDNENNRLIEFCKTRNILVKDIEMSEWQEYIRLTHAFRSGKRIKSHFDSISSGIGEFCSRICEGHWLDFDIIDDYTSYPTDASIHRDIVNVKAITIYVRLIDLLDMGEDRTPYVLWKFVAPRNKFSKLEWAKHRALQSVAFPQYQLARFIQVEGSTDDQNVYMAIMDFNRYVDEQFRQCSNILNRINHNYHKLDISHIDWRIAARGFEPMAIQFEFDRHRMFEILGDEIYRSNPYVFIRELLQNAIDAIEMRLETLIKKDIEFKPKIKIEVKEDNEFYIVQITDNGIGMDEYIIRNYLAVAGKSYYRSTDFQKEGLKMDPISRFGIGVLSCFMSSDYIEIDTFKDPHTTQKHEYLKISIPSKENYFKIKKNSEKLDIGTTFRVFVEKNKLPKNKKTGGAIDFNVTTYLKKTAGFVKYPILISEKGVFKTISNPNDNMISDDSVYSVNYSYPTEKAIFAQHLDSINEYFIEKKFHLRNDLGLHNYDGCITFLIPKFDNIDFMSEGLSWPINDVCIIDFNEKTKKDIKIKWKPSWGSFYSFEVDEDKTTIPERPFNVFMDGILLQNISVPEITLRKTSENKEEVFKYNYFSDSFITPQLIVNIPKPEGMKIDLARTSIESTEKWDRPIWIAFVEHIKKVEVEKIIKNQPDKKLIQLARLITFYKLSTEIIVDNLVDESKFPFPFLTKSSKVEFKDFKDLKGNTVRVAPEIYGENFFNLLEANYIKHKKYNGILNLWNGEDILINVKENHFLEKFPASIKNINSLLNFFLYKKYFFSDIQFVSSPLGSDFPLIIEIHKMKVLNQKEEINEDELLDKDLNIISSYEASQIRKILKRNFNTFPKLVDFPKPYQDKLFYSFKYLNINTPRAKLIVKTCIEIIKIKQNKKLSEIVVGKLFDLVNELHFCKAYYTGNGVTIQEFEDKFNELFAECKKNQIVENDISYKIEIDDFVNNSIMKIAKSSRFTPNIDSSEYLIGKEKWGRKL